MHQHVKEQTKLRKEIKQPLIRINEPNQKILDDFITESKNDGNAVRTSNDKNKNVRKFIKHLETNNTPITNINEDIINEFIKVIINQKSLTNVLRDCSLLRVFLRYLFSNGYIKSDYIYLVPKVKRLPKKIPTIWTEHEVNSFLNKAKELANSSEIQKRHYAMLLIAARLGLRRCDIINLKFDNIDWQNNSINIIQLKTKAPLTVPLTKEVGWAIIEYIKNGRPKSESKYIFVKHQPPFDKLTSPSFPIKNIADKAGVELNNKNKKGIHSFRFSLATRMLNKQIPMDIISSVLGHTSLNSTNIYLRIDCQNLRSCCLEVSNDF